MATLRSRGLFSAANVSLGLLAISYLIMVANMVALGFLIESNATQTQDKVCATTRAQIVVSLETVTYLREVTGAKRDPIRAAKVVTDSEQLLKEACGPDATLVGQ